MRRRLLVVAMVLVGCGLVLLWASRSGGPGAARENAGAVSREASGGPLSAPERPQEADARGSAHGGGTPSQEPSEADGVLEVEVLAGGRPWPGASVRLYGPGERTSSSGAVSWRLVGSGVTDARGRVRLVSRPGGYLVAVRAQGHAPLLREVVRPYGEPRTILSLSLLPGQPLTGSTVVYGTKEPLPLVELVLTAHGRDLESWQRAEAPDEERVFVTSDERGRFRVEGLAPGSYLLEARAPGHARAVLNSLKVPLEGPLTVALRVAGVIEGFVVDAQGRPAADAEVRVSGEPAQLVTTGAGGGFSVEVEPGAHTLSARRGEEAGTLDRQVVSTAGSRVRDVRIQLAPGAELRGRVVARASREGVAGARVDVSLSDGHGEAIQALTDGTGHFSVRGLVPGGYDARVSAPGFSPAVQRGLAVGPGGYFNAWFELTGPGVVEGRVKDGAGQPVAGAHVRGANRGGERSGPAWLESRSDATGHYRLEGLAAGLVSLTARREGAALGVTQWVEVEDSGTARVDFTLEGTGTLEGRVRAARRLPTGELEVTATADRRSASGFPDVGRTRVGTDGDFRMALPPGSYGLLLTERSGATPGGQLQVRIEEGRTTRVELEWAPQEVDEFRGLVLEPDGSPSPGAVVTLSSRAGSTLMMARTNEEGHFTIHLPQVETERLVMVGARQGGRSSEAMRVSPGREVVVRLRPAATIRGRVVGGGGPVRGFTLDLRLQKGSLPEGHGPWEFSGERFELRDAPAEPVWLMARAEGFLSGEVLVTPGAGSVLDVDIRLRASTAVQGRVVDAATSAPIANVLVFIEGDPAPAPERTGMDGRFTFEGVPLGERTLVVVGDPSQGRVRLPVKLKEGEAMVLSLGDIPLGDGKAPPP